MTKTVLDSLTRALRTAFPEAGIYTQDIPQGLKPGDFHVRLEKLSMADAPGGMNRWELRFLLTCFLPEGQPDLSLMEQVFRAAEWVILPDGLRLRGVRKAMAVREKQAELSVGFAFYAAPGAAETMGGMDYAAGVQR